MMAVLAGAKYFRRYGGAVLRLSSASIARAVLTLLKSKKIEHSWRQETSREGKVQFYLVELPKLPESFYRLPTFADICCRRAWIAGLFLVCGNVADPQKDYYLEWSPTSWDCTHLLLGCLIDENVEITVSSRGKGQLVCLKKSEDVATALSLIGATRARLELEEVRALKETNNDLHRLVNAETANIKRTADVAFRQISKLNFLKERGLLGGLQEGLAEIARLRLENPDLSYRELGEIMDPPLSRGCIGKKLAKLENIAEDIASSVVGNQKPTL